MNETVYAIVGLDETPETECSSVSDFSAWKPDEEATENARFETLEREALGLASVPLQGLEGTALFLAEEDEMEERMRIIVDITRKNRVPRIRSKWYSSSDDDIRMRNLGVVLYGQWADVLASLAGKMGKEEVVIEDLGEQI